MPSAYPPSVYFPAPYPPARARRALFPGGEGGDQGYFMQGASPLASPGLNPGGTGAGGVSRAGGGACPASPARLAAAVSGGELAFFVACLPPSVYFPAPYPPARACRALFPGGEGGDQGYFMQGAAPLASPALDRLRHLQNLPNGYPAGGCLSCCLPTLPLVYFSAPYPPSPLPRRGRGETKVISCKGLRPLHPRG